MVEKTIFGVTLEGERGVAIPVANVACVVEELGDDTLGVTLKTGQHFTIVVEDDEKARIYNALSGKEYSEPAKKAIA